MTVRGTLKRICVLPRLSGVGGMVSFNAKLAAGLGDQGVGVVHDLTEEPYDAVLVIGGTRQLAALWRAHRRGIPIVQRLDGINWLHRKLRTGVRHFLRAERNNWVLATIRRRLADRIVYQSEFVRGWWERKYGVAPVPNHVVLNGVDLARYTPDGPGSPPEDRYQVLLVEGTLGGGYEMGLEHAVGFVERLAGSLDRPVELRVVGRIAESLQQNVERSTRVRLDWVGMVPPDTIPELDRSAHVLFSADLHPACPNAVIEALACGLPIVAFDTGALSELVTDGAGRLVPYGGDPWRLEPPDIDGLAAAAREVLLNQAHFRNGARTRAEEALGLQPMLEGYLAAIEAAL